MGDIHTFWHKDRAERFAERTRRRYPGYVLQVVTDPEHSDRYRVMVMDGSRIGYVDRPRQVWCSRRRSNLKATWHTP